MNTPDARYRRNLVWATAIHLAAILSVIFWEQFGFHTDASARPVVELVVPADILGELPAGSGTGRGAYKAPEPGGATFLPYRPPTAPPPPPSPTQSTATKNAPDDIALPAKKPTRPSPTTQSTAKNTTATKTRPPTTPPPKTTSTTAGNTRPSGAGNADAIRNRFAKALTSSPDGTPYGDGRTAGGGKATGGRIGSPDGAPDGMVGGVGQGTPHWRYFQHVHDVLYDAWEQPGNLSDRRLVTMVALRIARDGTIADAQVRIGSGNRLMDESVMAAVRRVARLEPPPLPLVRGEFAIVTIDFQIEG